MAELYWNGRAAGRLCLQLILCCLGIGILSTSLEAAPTDPQLDTITVEAKRQLEHRWISLCKRLWYIITAKR